MLRTQRSRPAPRIPNRGSPLTRAGGPESDAAQQLYSQQARALPQSHGLHGDTVSGHTDSMSGYETKCECGKSSVRSTVPLVSYIGPCCLNPGETARPHISLVPPASPAVTHTERHD